MLKHTHFTHVEAYTTCGMEVMASCWRGQVSNPKKKKEELDLVLHMTSCAIMPKASAFEWFRRLLTI